MKELVVWAVYGAVGVVAWVMGAYIYRVEMLARHDRRAARLSPEVPPGVPRRGANGRFVGGDHS